MSRLTDAARKFGKHTKKLGKHAVAELTTLIRAVLILLLAVAAVLVVPYFALLIGVPVNPVVRLVEAIISWPVVILILGLFMLIRYREAITHVIRHGRFKFPGGLEVQVQLPDESESPGVETPSGETVEPEHQRVLSDYIHGLVAQKELSRMQVDQLKQALDKAISEKVYWEFRYQDGFFVQTTKQVLYWFSRVPPQERISFDMIWTIQIPDRQQREIILNVLLQGQMLEEQAGKIGITKKGNAFLRFIGMDPDRPASPGGGGA